MAGGGEVGDTGQVGDAGEVGDTWQVGDTGEVGDTCLLYHDPNVLQVVVGKLARGTAEMSHLNWRCSSIFSQPTSQSISQEGTTRSLQTENCPQRVRKLAENYRL